MDPLKIHTHTDYCAISSFLP